MTDDTLGKKVCHVGENRYKKGLFAGVWVWRYWELKDWA
jgi:hypothetical protein